MVVRYPSCQNPLGPPKGLSYPVRPCRFPSETDTLLRLRQDCSYTSPFFIDSCPTHNGTCCQVVTTSQAWTFLITRRGGINQLVVAARSAPPSAPESVFDRRGASPLQVYALRPVTNCYCLAVR